MSIIITNLFHGIAQFGWLFFAVGMFIMWGVVGDADVSFLHFGPLGRARGQVTQVENTGAREGEIAVFRSDYAFSLAGRRHTGVSYVTGDAPAVGETVEIEYDESDPSWSRIAGMRRAMFGPAVLLVLVFPAAGLVIALFSLGPGVRRVRLLRSGDLAVGKLIAKEATSITVNHRQIHEMTFEFVTRDGQRREATTRTGVPYKLESEEGEPLLYHPRNPSVIYVLDELPSRPRVDAMGELEGQPLTALKLFVIPALAIGINLLIALYRFDVL